MMELLKELFGKWVINKTQLLWKEGKRLEAVIFAISMFIVYLVTYIVITYFIFLLFASFSKVQDWWALNHATAVIVGEPTLLNSTISQTKEGYLTKEYQFRISSKLNGRIEYLVDINISLDKSHTVTIDYGKGEWNGILPNKKDDMLHPFEFKVDSPSSVDYSVEVYVRCGEKKRICGSGEIKKS